MHVNAGEASRNKPWHFQGNTGPSGPPHLQTKPLTSLLLVKKKKKGITDLFDFSDRMKNGAEIFTSCYFAPIDVMRAIWNGPPDMKKSEADWRS